MKKKCFTSGWVSVCQVCGIRVLCRAALCYLCLQQQNQIRAKRIMTKVCVVSNFHDAEMLYTCTQTYIIRSRSILNRSTKNIRDSIYCFTISFWSHILRALHVHFCLSSTPSIAFAVLAKRDSMHWARF